MGNNQPATFSRWQGLILKARGFVSAGRFYLLFCSPFLVALGILFSYYFEEGKTLLSLAIPPLPPHAFLPLHLLSPPPVTVPFILSETGLPRKLSSRNSGNYNQTSGGDSNKNRNGKSSASQGGSKPQHQQDGRNTSDPYPGLSPPSSNYEGGTGGGGGQASSPPRPNAPFFSDSPQLSSDLSTKQPSRSLGGSGEVTAEGNEGGRTGERETSTGSNSNSNSGNDSHSKRRASAGTSSMPQPVRWLGGENPLRPAMCSRLNAQKRVAKQFILLALLFIDFHYDEKSPLSSPPATPRSAGGMISSPRGEDRWTINERVRFTDANRTLNRLIAEAHSSAQNQDYNNVLPRFLWQNESPCRMAALTGKHLPLIAIRLFDLLREARSSPSSSSPPSGTPLPSVGENRDGPRPYPSPLPLSPPAPSPPLVLADPPKRKIDRLSSQPFPPFSPDDDDNGSHQPRQNAGEKKEHDVPPGEGGESSIHRDRKLKDNPPPRGHRDDDRNPPRQNANNSFQSKEAGDNNSSLPSPPQGKRNLGSLLPSLDSKAQQEGKPRIAIGKKKDPNLVPPPQGQNNKPGVVTAAGTSGAKPGPSLSNSNQGGKKPTSSEEVEGGGLGASFRPVGGITSQSSSSSKDGGLQKDHADGFGREAGTSVGTVNTGTGERKSDSARSGSSYLASNKNGTQGKTGSGENGEGTVGPSAKRRELEGKRMEGDGEDGRQEGQGRKESKRDNDGRRENGLKEGGAILDRRHDGQISTSSNTGGDNKGEERKKNEEIPPSSSSPPPRGGEKLLVEDGEVAFHYFVLQLMKEDSVNQPPLWDTAQIQRIAKNSRISTRPNASLYELINHAASVWSSYIIIEELQRGFVVERMVEDWIGPIVGKMTGRYHDALATVAESFREPIMDEPLCGRMYLLLDGFRTSPIASIFYENTITAQQLNQFRNQLLSHIEAEMEKAVQQLADELRLGLKSRQIGSPHRGMTTGLSSVSYPSSSSSRSTESNSTTGGSEGDVYDSTSAENHYNNPSPRRHSSPTLTQSSSSSDHNRNDSRKRHNEKKENPITTTTTTTTTNIRYLEGERTSSDFHPVTRRQLPIARLAGYIVRLGSGTFHAGVVGEGNTFAGNQRLIDTMTDDSLLAEIQLFDEASLALQGDDVPPLPTLAPIQRTSSNSSSGSSSSSHDKGSHSSQNNDEKATGGRGYVSSGTHQNDSNDSQHSKNENSSSSTSSSSSMTTPGRGKTAPPIPSFSSSRNEASSSSGYPDKGEGSLYSYDPLSHPYFKGDWVSGSNPDATVPVITAMQALKRHINSAGGSRSIWFFKRSLVVYSSLEGVDLPDPLGGHLGLPPSTDYDIHFFVYVPMSDYSSSVGEKLRKAFLRMIFTNTGGPRTWALNGEEPLVEDSRISELGTAKLTDEGQALKLKTFGIELDDNQRTNVQKLIQRDLVLIHYKIKGLATMRGQLTPGEEWRVMRAERMFARILKQCRNILDIPYAAVIKRQSVSEQRQIKKTSEVEGGLPVWVLALAVLCTAVPLITFMFCLQFHKRLPVPWWISCICSSSPPWETNADDEHPGDEDADLTSVGHSDCMGAGGGGSQRVLGDLGLSSDEAMASGSILRQGNGHGGSLLDAGRGTSGSDGGKAGTEVTSQGSTTHAGGGGSILDGENRGGGGSSNSPIVGMMTMSTTAPSHSSRSTITGGGGGVAGGWHDASTRWLNNSSVCSDHLGGNAISVGQSVATRSGSGGDFLAANGLIHHPNSLAGVIGTSSSSSIGGGSNGEGTSSPQRQGSHSMDNMPGGPSSMSMPLRKKTFRSRNDDDDDLDNPLECFTAHLTQSRKTIEPSIIPAVTPLDKMLSRESSILPTKRLGGGGSSSPSGRAPPVGGNGNGGAGFAP
ncbi:transmembrane protein [Cystoisospora suis]|uniref:Transmembrane protein n=1 Tax=Cystoisospora suis TaxID=483139 RepID=A0A2C6KSU3_9APIC|nr:transmembrane protein [Cystoisospora suis]